MRPVVAPASLRHRSGRPCRLSRGRLALGVLQKRLPRILPFRTAGDDSRRDGGATIFSETPASPAAGLRSCWLQAGPADLLACAAAFSSALKPPMNLLQRSSELR